MKPDFPEREEITVEWLRKPFGKGAFGAHKVLSWHYLNLPARGLLRYVLDLRGPGGSPMHYVCKWQEALNATDREFLTPEFLLVTDCGGETPLEAGTFVGVQIPWERFPVRPWIAYLDALTQIHRQINQYDEANSSQNPQGGKVEKFIAKVEALKKLEETKLETIE